MRRSSVDPATDDQVIGTSDLLRHDAGWSGVCLQAPWSNQIEVLGVKLSQARFDARPRLHAELVTHRKDDGIRLGDHDV